MNAARTLIFYAILVVTIRGRSMHWESVGPFLPSATLLKGVRFGGELFVAWAGHALVFTPDGIRWERGKGFPATGQINAVAYGGDRFVAVGKTGHISFSKDGAHWKTQLISGSPAFFDVAYGAGLFVAVGAEGVIATSPDGERWTLQSGPGEDLTLIAYGNNTFVASARGADGRTPAGFVISTDGQQWRSLPPAPLYAEVDCQSPGCKTATLAGGLIFHEGKFVLLTLTTEPIGTFNTFFRSDDGSTWTTGERTSAPVVEIESPYSPGVMNSLNEANGMLVPPNVAFGNGLFVKVEYDLWSGVDPYQMSRVPRVQGMTSLAGSGNVMVGVGMVDHLPRASDPPISIVLSTNHGQTFESIAPPAGAHGLAAVRYADGKFVAVGIKGTIIVSPDGRTWTKAQSKTEADLYDLIYAEGKWSAVGSSGEIVSSTDAVSFSRGSIGNDIDLHSIAYGNGRYVVVAPHEGMFTSTNGGDWTQTGTNLFGGAKAVAFGNNTFVTSGFACATSTNGVDWQLAGSPSASGLRMAYAQGYFASPRLTSGEVEVSRDGKSWEVILVDPKTALSALDVIDGRLWVSGGVGATWRSVLNPELKAVLEGNGNVHLTITVDDPGTYRMFASETGLPGSWRPADFLNVLAETQRTYSSASTKTQFYQVRREYP